MFKDDKRESIGRRTIRGMIVFTLLLTIVVSLPVTYDFSPSEDELLKNVKESIGGFTGDAEQFDDITMLAFRYNGK